MRFPGFEGGWEVVNLSDIATFFKGKGISKEHLSDDGNPCILYGELYTKYKSEIIEEVLSRTKLNTKELVNGKINDVLIPSSGESAIDIATARCVNVENVLLGGDLNIIRPYEASGKFISYQLNGKRKRDIAKLAQGSSVTHLYNESLKKLRIALPNRNEQERISNLLGIIDARISTQSKIIEVLKSSMLKISVQIFEGKYRFRKTAEEFFPKWKQVKVRELGDCIGGGTPSTGRDEFWNGGIPWISSSDLNSDSIHEINISRFITDEAVEKSATKMVPAKSVLLVSRVGVGKVAVNENKLCTSQDFTTLIPYEDNYIFLGYMLKFHANKLLAFNQGTSIKGFVKKELEELEVSLPVREEQELIAQFLTKLDLKIKTEKQILSLYKSQKASLLKDLFV